MNLTGVSLADGLGGEQEGLAIFYLQNSGLGVGVRTVLSLSRHPGRK